MKRRWSSIQVIMETTLEIVRSGESRICMKNSAGVPLIMRGRNVPVGKRIKSAVSLVDAYPTIIEAVGLPVNEADRDLPGTSLFHILDNSDDDRTILSEYHAVGAITGMFMVRFGKYKYIRYENYPSLSFLIWETDLKETENLASDPHFENIVQEGERRLREICDPTEVNARAFSDQEKSIQIHGGAETLLNAGSYPYTPAPGEAPRYA